MYIKSHDITSSDPNVPSSPCKVEPFKPMYIKPHDISSKNLDNTILTTQNSKHIILLFSQDFKVYNI